MIIEVASESPQGGIQQDRSGDSVDIVIAMYGYFFSTLEGSCQALCRPVHIREELRVGKISQTRCQKLPGGIQIVSAADQQPGDQRRDTQLSAKGLEA